MALNPIKLQGQIHDARGVRIPKTSDVTGRCSNQLSYGAKCTLLLTLRTGETTLFFMAYNKSNLKEFRQCLPPFSDYKSSGPTRDGGDGRMRLHLLGGTGNRSMSYARYLFSVVTGQEPTEGYDVDHVDGNRCNDAVGNLQAITRHENIVKYAGSEPRSLARRTLLKLECPACHKVFFKNICETHLNRGGSATYCSRACGYLWKRHLGETQTYSIVENPEIPTSTYAEPWESWSSAIEYKGGERPPSSKDGVPCERCGTPFNQSSRHQRFCSKSCVGEKGGQAYAEKHTKVNKDLLRPTIEKAAEGHISWDGAGRSLGISGNALKKWARKLGYAIPVKNKKNKERMQGNKLRVPATRATLQVVEPRGLEPL